MILKKHPSFTFAIQLVLVIVIGLTFSFCNNTVMHSESTHIEKNEWKDSDTLFFTFNTKDTLSLFDFYFEIRNTTDYELQNLFLFITAYYPGDTYSRDTAECILAAPDGKWHGKGIGKHKDNRFLFRKGVRFRKPGNYIIAVNQAMRLETLNGISDVGILIKKQENQ